MRFLHSNALKACLVAILLSSTFLFQSCDSSSGTNATTRVPAINDTNLPAPERFQFTGIGTIGIFDASIERATGDTRLWMSFSAVDPSAQWPAENNHAVSTHLAHSDDNGETWVYDKKINSLIDVTISGFANPFNAGTWHNEVSTLVYDASAPVNERWKLIWHRYLLINFSEVGLPQPNDYEGRRFEHGWFSYKHAATPTALDVAQEKKLFVGTGYNNANDVSNGPTFSPVAGAPLISLSSAFPQLAACSVFTEPALLSANGKLFFASACIETSGSSVSEMKVFLLSCNNPCDVTDSNSWTFVNTLTTLQIAQDMGYLRFNAPDLFRAANGQYYMLITPVSNVPVNEAYNGCLVFQFSNLNAGTLVKTNGLPKVMATYNGVANSFNGACTYDAGASASGVIHSQLVLNVAEKFQLFKTFLKF